MNDKICHKVRNHYHYTGKCGSAKHGKYNSKYSVPKEMLIVFRWLSFYYKKLSQKNWKKSYLEKEKEEKEVQELKKNKKKKIKDITKPDLTDYKSLTEQDSWQALY